MYFGVLKSVTCVDTHPPPPPTGPLFYNHDEDLNKDTVNCSLRRKLFGKPERIEQVLRDKKLKKHAVTHTHTHTYTQDSRSFCEEAQVDCTTTKSPSTPRDSQQAW